jgi:hypothetical protein
MHEFFFVFLGLAWPPARQVRRNRGKRIILNGMNNTIRQIDFSLNN